MRSNSSPHFLDENFLIFIVQFCFCSSYLILRKSQRQKKEEIEKSKFFLENESKRREKSEEIRLERTPEFLDELNIASDGNRRSFVVELDDEKIFVGRTTESQIGKVETFVEKRIEFDQKSSVKIVGQFESIFSFDEKVFHFFLGKNFVSVDFDRFNFRQIFVAPQRMIGRRKSTGTFLFRHVMIDVTLSRIGREPKLFLFELSNVFKSNFLELTLTLETNEVFFRIDVRRVFIEEARTDDAQRFEFVILKQNRSNKVQFGRLEFSHSLNSILRRNRRANLRLNKRTE